MDTAGGQEPQYVIWQGKTESFGLAAKFGLKFVG
jgi:hypothetical protein